MSAERIFISEGVRKEEFIFCSTASLLLERCICMA